MKEYRLVNWYPSLPTEWKDSSVQIIVVERETGYQLHPSLKGLTRQLAFPLNKSEVEDSSNFWEDIIKKKFEILSFYTREGDGILDKKKNGLFSYGNYKGCYSEEDLLSGDNDRMDLEEDEIFDYKIYSVKRLLDGEVFSVGDIVKRKSFSALPFTIHRINIDEKGDFRAYQGKRGDDNYCDILLKKCQHIEKESLFKTEDGKEIFEGDEFWFINKTLRFNPEKSKNYVADSRVLYFSNKESAETYIKWNKRLFSGTDIENLVKKHCRDKVDSSLFAEVRKLVNERV